MQESRSDPSGASAPPPVGLSFKLILANGDWLLTSSVWKADNSIKVYASANQGMKREQRTAFISDDGTVYIVYDHQRTPLGEVLLATFTEEDIRAGKAVTDKARFREVVSSLPVTDP